MLGSKSLTKRQVDILVKVREIGFELIIVIDCKYFNKKIDVKQIDEFAGFLIDIKANKGVLITNIGYTLAAKNRADNDLFDISIDIIEFDKLDRYQGFGGAMIWKDNCMVSFPCPSGWLIDNSDVSNYSLCKIYPYGLNLHSAQILQEFMYCNIIPKANGNPTIYEFLKVQEEDFLKDDPRGMFTYSVGYRNECETTSSSVLRLIETPLYKSIEYTSILDFERMIFYTVLLTPILKSKHYLKKLEYITNGCIPLGVNVIGG